MKKFLIMGSVGFGLFVCLFSFAYAQDQKQISSTPPPDNSPRGIVTQLEGLRLEFDALKQGLPTDQIVGYDGGFFIKSRDEKFSLHVNGLLQPRYVFYHPETADDRHSFLLRNAKLVFSGNLYSPKLEYAFVLTLPERPMLGNFDVNYAFGDPLVIHFWLDDVPLNPGYSLGPEALQFVTHSMADLRYNFGAGLAVAADGEFGKFKYVAGVFNGYNRGLALNLNNELAYGARLQFDIFGETDVFGGNDFDYSEKPTLAMGAAGGFAHLDDGVQARVMLGTSDLAFKFKGYSLRMAGYFRFTDLNQFAQAQNDTGFSIETGYFIFKKRLELALRASATIDDLTNAGVGLNMVGEDDVKIESDKVELNLYSLGDAGGDSDNEWEYTAALNYYFGPEFFNTKVQAQYTFLHDGQPGADDLRSHVGLLQLVMEF